MPADQGLHDQETRVRQLADSKGLQLRRADHADGLWHLIDPSIDGKLYAFAFTKPHTYSLGEIEDMLNRSDPENR